MLANLLGPFVTHESRSSCLLPRFANVFVKPFHEQLREVGRYDSEGGEKGSSQKKRDPDANIIIRHVQYDRKVMSIISSGLFHYFIASLCLSLRQLAVSV